MYVCVFVWIYTLRELSSQEEHQTVEECHAVRGQNQHVVERKGKKKKFWTKPKIQSEENKSRRIEEVVWILRRIFESTWQQNYIGIHGKLIIIIYYLLYI